MLWLGLRRKFLSLLDCLLKVRIHRLRLGVLQRPELVVFSLRLSERGVVGNGAGVGEQIAVTQTEESDASAAVLSLVDEELAAAFQ
jgi:hypothetical protein